MATTNILLVLYVYRCSVCDHKGKLRLLESSPDVATACSSCGAKVIAEWGGVVKMAINKSV